MRSLRPEALCGRFVFFFGGLHAGVADRQTADLPGDDHLTLEQVGEMESTSRVCRIHSPDH